MLQNVTPLRKSAPGPHLTALMNMSLAPRLPRNLHLCRSSSNIPRLPSFLEILFWQGAQSLAPATQKDASTSKRGANIWCFVHFDFAMCFAPQRRARFPHLNFQKCSEHGLFFWVFYILISKRASRHNSVHFFDISTSKSAMNPSVFYTFDFEICFPPLGLHCTFVVVCTDTPHEAFQPSSVPGVWALPKSRK